MNTDMSVFMSTYAQQASARIETPQSTPSFLGTPRLYAEKKTIALDKMGCVFYLTVTLLPLSETNCISPPVSNTYFNTLIQNLTLKILPSTSK